VEAVVTFFPFIVGEEGDSAGAYFLKIR